MPVSSSRSSDVEKIGPIVEQESDGDSHRDLEKQDPGQLQREASRHSNTPAVPGLRTDSVGGILGPDDGYDDEDDDDPEEAGRGRLPRVVSRVLSRSTSKSSWNPGPPPDGGLKAWTAGEYFVFAASAFRFHIPVQ